MSEEWCEDNDVILNDCYIEGVVDVVNRKWLEHTPTAYIDWIEPHSTGRLQTDTTTEELRVESTDCAHFIQRDTTYQAALGTTSG